MIDNVYNVPMREVPLSELVRVRSARKPEIVEEYPFIGSSPYIDIKTLETATVSRYAVGSNFRVSDCDLVIVKDGHRSGKVFHAMDGIAATTLAIISHNSSDIIMDYLYCYLSYCYDDFQLRKRGETVGHLDMEYLIDLRIPVPDVNIQIKVSEKYHRIEKLAKKTKMMVLQLKEFSDSMRNRELKNSSDNLIQLVEMMQKAWLHQIFDRIR